MDCGEGGGSGMGFTRMWSTFDFPITKQHGMKGWYRSARQCQFQVGSYVSSFVSSGFSVGTSMSTDGLGPGKDRRSGKPSS